MMLFYQIGELFQSYAVGKSRRSIASLMDIRPDFANVERDGQIVQVDPEEVQRATALFVRPGERIPLDGTVLEGVSALNTSALTGKASRVMWLTRDLVSGQRCHQRMREPFRPSAHSCDKAV